jgi:Predicted flavoprotein involved in K+ transport
MNSRTNTDVVIIGGGQAGLAMSAALTDRSIDHVVLERGDVAHSWTTERWDSLRLLTPNWMSRLPRFAYDGSDPDGYMTASEVADYLRRYRRRIDAPVVPCTTVSKVTATGSGCRVDTDRGTWRARAVVVATGACSTPRLPDLATDLPGNIWRLTPITYRNPGQIDDGAVLVVGASASGSQIADELVRSGRDVILAVGDHVRVPRTYRGMNIHWWLDRLGILDERAEDADDIDRARRVSSLQLIGSPEPRAVDLNALTARGVRLAGKLVGYTGRTLQFSGSLSNRCVSADLKQARLLDSIDDYVSAHGLERELEPPHRPAPTRVGTASTEIDSGGIRTVIWATGYRPHTPWLDPSLLDRKGAIIQDHGVMAIPGMFALGLPFMCRRKSAFIDGVGADAMELAGTLHTHLGQLAVPVS